MKWTQRNLTREATQSAHSNTAPLNAGRVQFVLDDQKLAQTRVEWQAIHCEKNGGAPRPRSEGVEGEVLEGRC